MSKTRYITYTAVLLALAVAFQALRAVVPALALFGPFNLQQILIGSLVNLTIILACWLVGFGSGAVLSVLTPVVAFFQGAVPPAVPQMIAAIALGNLALALLASLLRRNKVLSVIFAAITKFAVLFALVTWVVIPVFVDKLDKAEALKKILSVGFAWPQLATAAVGGILALILFPALKKAVGVRES